MFTLSPSSFFPFFRYGIKLDEMLETQMSRREMREEGKGADTYPVGFVAARVCWMMLDHFQLAALSDKEITVDVRIPFRVPLGATGGGGRGGLGKFGNSPKIRPPL